MAAATAASGTASFDPHLWLDPENAKAMAALIADTLEKADPENASRYAANEAALVKDLGTSFEQELPVAIGADLAAWPDEAVDAELYRTLLYVTHLAPSFSLRGGTREILRGIVARGMGLR